MRVILVHGYKSGPELNFLPWLTMELRAKGFDVVCPQLPEPENPDPDAWTKALLEVAAPLDKDTIIVGHSLGGAAALRLIEAAEARTTPHALVLIATPWMIRDEKFRGFFMSELDFEVLMWRASKIVVMHGNDDAIIPVDHGKRLADALHAAFIPVDGVGHFQGAEYPVILDTICAIAADPVVYAPGETLEPQFTDVQ